MCGVCSGATCTGGAQGTASYACQPVVPQFVPVNVTLGVKSCHP
jgi:hypothetical protein